MEELVGDAPPGEGQAVEQVRLSADDLARLAEIDPSFVQRALQAGALQKREVAGEFGMRDAVRLRFLKAWDAAEADFYEAQVEEPLRQAGATEQDLLDTSGMAGAQLPPLFQQTLTAVYRRHRQHVWLNHSIGHLERILEANGLHQRLEAPPCVCASWT
jgi:hypothetical protein